MSIHPPNQPTTQSHHAISKASLPRSHTTHTHEGPGAPGSLQDATVGGCLSFSLFTLVTTTTTISSLHLTAGESRHRIRAFSPLVFVSLRSL